MLSPACPLNSSRKRCLKESATLLVSFSYFAARYRGRWVSMISKSQLQTTPAMACPWRELQMAWRQREGDSAGRTVRHMTKVMLGLHSY